MGFSEEDNYIRVMDSQGSATVDVFKFLSQNQNPMNWVVFSTGGRLELQGSGNIWGLAGTNATTLLPSGQRPVYFDSGAYIATPTQNFYIGPNAVSTQIAYIAAGSGNDYQTTLRELIERDQVKKLTAPVVYAVPSCFLALNFQPVYTETTKITSMYKAIDGQNALTYILNSGNFSLVRLNANQTVRIVVGDSDMVLNISELIMGGNSKIEIEKLSPASMGNVFLMVSKMTLDSTAKILPLDGNPDKVFLFYSGSQDVTFGVGSEYYGSVYTSGPSKITFSGRGVLRDVLALEGSVTVNSANMTLGGLYIKSGEATVIGATLLTGILSGGTKVAISGGVPTFSFIFAPSAVVTIENNTGINAKPATYETVKGIVVGKEVIIKDSRVVGPAYQLPLCLGIPVPVIEEEVYIEPSKDCSSGGWYVETSGQICQASPNVRTSSQPAIIGAKGVQYGGQKTISNNPNEIVMTWKAPYIEFLSPLALMTSLKLESKYFIFNNYLGLYKNDVRVTLIPAVGGESIVQFGNVYSSSNNQSQDRRIEISNKAFRFTKELIITPSTTVNSLKAQGAMLYEGTIAVEFY